MKVLITGGAGFIGSTIASACLDDGIEPVIVDDLSTGLAAFGTRHAFYQGDIADGVLLDRVFAEHPDIAAAVHCAAHIVVPESVAQPLTYYRNNVGKTVELLDGLLRNGCHRIVFSSSASIYAAGPDLAVDENSPIAPQSPYAQTKAMTEEILRDTAAATGLGVLSLRYFNPVGADPELRTGLQNPTPSHALGKLIESYREHTPFAITGTDWPTRDGSAIRDYIHVWDLARAHVAALRRFDDVTSAANPYVVINLGTGTGTTVRELVAAFQAVTEGAGDVIETGSRPGDVIGCFTRSDQARELLGWTPQISLEDAVRHSLAWAELLPALLAATA